MRVRSSSIFALTFGTWLTSVTCSLAIGPKLTDADQSAIAQALSHPKTNPGLLSPSAALEGPIDPNSYRLGPGDRLEFDVWGAFEQQQEVLVAPDGRIAIATVGQVPVAGLTLTAADSLVRKVAASIYPHGETRLRLLGLRKMKVAISGAVDQPASYEVTALDRLTIVVGMAGGFKIPDTQQNEEDALRELTVKPKTLSERRALQQVREQKQNRPQASMRHITITHLDGKAEEVDLQRFYAQGDLAFNPILQNGDEIHVPLIEREVGVLNLFGAVKNPGEFEFRPGDRLRDLIDLAGGLRADALTNNIAIVRFAPDGKTRTEIETDLTASDVQGPELLPDDRIFVRRKPDFRQKFQVEVKGEVFFPGTYAIDEDHTKLSDIIKTAGGLTNRANLYSAHVSRQSLEQVEDPEFERLKSLSVAEMTDMEYQYFKIRSREEAPSVVVDFGKLFGQGDSSQDIILRDKDEINVPTVSPTVKVAGQVTNQGLIRYVEGQNYEYYIGKAGGFSWNAREGKLRLIKAHSGIWIKPKKDTPIEIGDTIFVPEKQEIDWWVLSKDMLLAVSQIATVMIMIRSLK